MRATNISVEGKVAIVTGAKRGIGEDIALTLAQAGADVAVCTRVVEDGLLEAVAKEIKHLGRRALSIQVDIGRKVDVDNMVERVVDDFGHIDMRKGAIGIVFDGLI